MGGATSTIYGHCRRLLIRYNAENRVHKFLEKGKLPLAPRHSKDSLYEEMTLPKEELKKIHEKNEQLSEYLKKVYLTSTSQVTGTPSTRPKPKKENEFLKTKMFYEPETPAPGCCTLTNIIDILIKFQDNPKTWNVDTIADKFNLDRRDVVHLVMYHSLFKLETFQDMHAKEVKEEQEKLEFQIHNRLEKKPLKQIKGN